MIVLVPRSAPVHSLDVDGRTVQVSNPDKVLFPGAGMTKADVIEYLITVSDALLTQLRDRPVTRIRYPHGSGGDRFFEKNAPPGAPSWLRTAPVSGERGGETVTYPVFDHLAALVWAGNLAALELHTPQWRVGPRGAVHPPDRLVVDLDPGQGTGLDECAHVAHLVAERLGDEGLEAVPVTSGSSGLHLYASLHGRSSSDEVRARAERLARSLAKEHPRDITATMGAANRRGKVLIDWSQNSRSKTTITPYSLRAKHTPFVAAPRSWPEITDGLTQLTPDDVTARLAQDGDLLG